MAGFSDYLEVRILESSLRGASFPAPSTVYVALFTSNPNDDASGPEVADSNYVRQDAAQGGAIDSGWTAPSSGQVKNAKQIEFPAIADDRVTVTHFALYDSQTGGNMLYSSALTASKTLEVNDVLTFDIESITIALD